MLAPDSGIGRLGMEPTEIPYDIREQDDYGPMA